MNDVKTDLTTIMDVKTDLTTLESVWDILDSCGLEFMLSGKSKFLSMIEEFIQKNPLKLIKKGEGKVDGSTILLGVLITKAVYIMIGGLLGKGRKLRQLYETVTGEKNTIKRKEVLEIDEVSEALTAFFTNIAPKLAGLYNLGVQATNPK